MTSADASAPNIPSPSARAAPTTPQTAHASTVPIPAGGRYRALDVLRGIAILGTLGTNIFTWIIVQAPAGESPFELMATQLTNGKFLSLLTIMFGIGLAIQFDSAERRNRRWPHVYLWRGIILFLDGLLHYLLVFTFDVLMAYSVTGIIVAYVLLTTPRVQRWILGAAAAVHLAFVSLPLFGVSLPFLGTYGNAQQPSDNPRDDVSRGGELVTRADLGAEAARGGGMPVQSMSDDSWWSGVVYRWQEFLSGREEAIFILPMSIALFLTGVMLWRAGLFQPHGKRLRRWLMVIGAVALTYDLAGSAIPELAPPGMFGRYVVPVLVAPGIAAAVAAFLQRRQPGWFGRRLEDVGRLALTCYVGQNLVSMFYFSDWALNLDAKLPAELGFGASIICYVMVALTIMVFASLWRLRFERGPLEWLWAKCYDGAMRLTPSWSAPRTPVATPPSAA